MAWELTARLFFLPDVSITATVVAVPEFNAEQREASCRAGNHRHFAEELCTGFGAGRNQRGGKRLYPTAGDLHSPEQPGQVWASRHPRSQAQSVLVQALGCSIVPEPFLNELLRA